jgi:uncharacterized protein YneF (UPF0154 family)
MWDAWTMIQILGISLLVLGPFVMGLLLGSYLVRKGIDTAQKLHENAPIFNEPESDEVLQETT